LIVKDNSKESSEKTFFFHPERVSGSLNLLILLADAEPILNQVQHKVQKHNILAHFVPFSEISLGHPNNKIFVG